MRISPELISKPGLEATSRFTLLAGFVGVEKAVSLRNQTA